MSDVFHQAAKVSRRSVLAAASAPFVGASAAQRSVPNVLLILCDQMRGDALSGLGSKNARTPNLDRLMESGVTFERCFANNPVCVPSRKSLFSGLYPHQHGSLSNPDGHHLKWDGSMAQYLQKAGYRTGYVGKNHTFEKEAAARFDFASIRDREPFRAYSKDVPPHWFKDSAWPEEKCYPNVNTEAALEFLGKSKPADPFFLTVSYFDPHPPYMAPAGYAQRYSRVEMDLPPMIPPGAISPRLGAHAAAMGFPKLTAAELADAMRYYFAAIEAGVDKQVGRLMRALAASPFKDNTLVIFASDHGDFMGHHGMVRKAMYLYDHLLHIPLIMYHPTLAHGGRRTANFAQLIDIYPTLVDFAGGKPPAGLMGRSLRPELASKTAPDHGRTIFTSAGYGELNQEKIDAAAETTKKPLHTRVFDTVLRGDHKTAMVRTAEWKLILNETHPPELFHMKGGVVERENVADQPSHGSVRRDLEKKLTAWWRW